MGRPQSLLRTLGDRLRSANVEPRNSVTTRPISHLHKKHICLFGLFGMNNYGNDGSLEAMLIFLRRTWPGAELSCICLNPDKVERDHKISSVPIKWSGRLSPLPDLWDRVTAYLPHKLANWVYAVHHLHRFDALIVPGTSTLCDYRANPSGAPYALFRWAVAAKLCGTKLYFINTGAGPIRRSLSRSMLKYAARSAYYRSFRDTVSKDFLASIGVDTRRDQIYPDLVFRLPLPVPSVNKPAGPYPTTIAVGVMDYNGWDGHARPDDTIYETYLTKMANFVGGLLDRGYRVRMLIGESADQRAVDDVRKRLGDKGRNFECPEACDESAGQFVVEPVGSLHDLMQQMMETQVVVASRFHNIICALKLSRPSISIGYEAKNEAVMREFCVGGFCHRIEDIDTGKLMEQVEALLQNQQFYTERIGRGLARTQDRIREQDKILKQII